MSSIYDYVEKEKPKTSSNHSICSFNCCITYPKRTTQLTQQKAKEITTVNVRVENYEQPKMDDHECALTHLMSTDSVRRSHNPCVSGPMVSTWFLTAAVGATPVWWFLWFMQRQRKKTAKSIFVAIYISYKWRDKHMHASRASFGIQNSFHFGNAEQ